MTDLDDDDMENLLLLRWQNQSFGNDPVTQAADFFHFGFDDIARLQPPGRLVALSPRGDAPRGASGQHIAGVEPHLRPIRDHSADTKNHLTKIGILTHSPDNRYSHLQALRVGNCVSCPEVWPYREEA